MRLPWLAVPCALALWLLLAASGVQPRLDRSISDALARATSPTAPVSQSIVVDIDDASLRALRDTLGDWPYSRDVYAHMLDYLRQTGVRLVVMDIVFAGPRPGDAVLAAALANGPPTVLAAAGLAQGRSAADAFVPVSASEQQTLQRFGLTGAVGLTWDSATLPPAELLDAMRNPGGLGVVSASLDSDGVLRQIPLLHRVAGRSLPSLALAARLRADGIASWRVEDHNVVAGAHRWPVDEVGRLRLRLPGGDGRATQVSWQRLMRAALGESQDPALARQLAGRTVFVGSSAFFSDVVTTPMGRRSGTAVNASVFEALGAEPLPLLREHGPWVWGLNALVLALGLLPLLLRPQVPAALLGAGGMALVSVTAAWRGVLLAPAAGVYLLVLALVFTAAERKRRALEHEREITRERELAEARSRANTELLTHVSHEMRTPMNAVLGLSSILARTPLQPEQARYVDLLGHAGRQVFSLINDLLDNAHIESGRLELVREPFSLVDVVTLQVELQRVRAEAQGLWLRVFVRSPDTRWVLGDAKRVAQIVTNLVGNAVKFTATGGVLVELQREADGQVLIAVQDTGVPIAADRIERIFRPFEQADAQVGQQFGGFGLGLAITRSLAQMMGGDVSVRSDRTEGNRFEARLNLPVAPPPPPRGEAPPPPPPPPPMRPLKLLLAEDNDVNALVIEGMLTPLGHQLNRVHNGLQAIDAMRAQVFDLVLMDMLMPQMDGLTATRQWRAIEATEGRQRTPILALTANAYESDVQQSQEAGCDAHLTKPISLSALLAALAVHARD